MHRSTAWNTTEGLRVDTGMYLHRHGADLRPQGHRRRQARAGGLPRRGGPARRRPRGDVRRRRRPQQRRARRPGGRHDRACWCAPASSVRTRWTVGPQTNSRCSPTTSSTRSPTCRSCWGCSRDACRVKIIRSDDVSLSRDWLVEVGQPGGGLDKGSDAMGRRGEHAVVLGASMGGLLSRPRAERLLRPGDRGGARRADRSRRTPRRGVPQSRQPHVLLSRCGQIAEELFPGLLDELVADGAHCWSDGDLSRFHVFFGGHLVTRTGSIPDPGVADDPLTPAGRSSNVTSGAGCGASRTFRSSTVTTSSTSPRPTVGSRASCSTVTPTAAPWS